MELIGVEELIKKLKENNINFGKGDPYNRLRYYTKIGLIPHMIRKKNDKNTNSGHFPSETFDRIKEIERLKDEGMDNEAILKKLSSELPKKEYFKFYEKIKEKLSINYFFIFLIIIGLITEIYRFGNNKMFNQNIITDEKSINQNLIKDSGISFFPSGQKKVFIPSKIVEENSNIIITFKGSIFPATNFYISEVKQNVGFYVETNIEIAKETRFNWLIFN